MRAACVSSAAALGTAFMLAFGFSPAAQARGRHRPKAPSAQTIGLGRSCKKRADCHGKKQVCLKENDAEGKRVAIGFCVLPCAPYEAGTTKVVPGEPPMSPAEYAKKKKAPPPRCPRAYECRTAGAGVPIDMCVKG